MYLELFYIASAAAFFFVIAAIGMLALKYKGTAITLGIAAGLILVILSALTVYEGISLPSGDIYVDTQSGNCTTFAANQTICDMNYTSNKLTQYRNMTGSWDNWAAPTNYISLAYFGVGIILILWSVMLTAEQMKGDKK